MAEHLSMRVQSAIRDVPEFPKEGILFKDSTPVLQDADLFSEIIEYFVNHLRDKDIEAIAGIESRGFLFGAPIAHALGVGLVLIRKPGKLPAETISIEYDLEYGTDTLEVHTAAVAPGPREISSNVSPRVA